jgi:hypothetical protein
MFICPAKSTFNQIFFKVFVRIQTQILRQTKLKKRNSCQALVKLSMFVCICLFHRILTLHTFAAMNGIQEHWIFVGNYQLNDSEEIFASANSKVCFAPPEIFSVAQNYPVRRDVFGSEVAKFKKM